MDTQNRLQIAYHYIERRDYARARAVLEKTNTPEARQLLRKLNATLAQGGDPRHLAATLDAVAAVSSDNNTAFSSVIVDDKPKRKIKRDEFDGATAHAPFNPNVWLFVGFFFMPLSNIVLSFNWRRLGRREWFAPSLLLGIVLPVASVVVVVAMVSAFLRMSYQTLQPLLMLTTFISSLNLAFMLGLVGLQNRSYRLWKQDDIEGMLDYQYPLKKAAAAVFVLVFFATIGSYFNYKDILSLSVYSDNDMSLSYAPGWMSQPCTTDEGACVREIVHNLYFNDRYSKIVILRYEGGDRTSANAEEVTRAEYLAESPSATFMGVSDTTLDGYASRVRQLQWRTSNGTPAYEHQYFTMTDDHFYIFQVYSSCSCTWQSDRITMENILHNIDFK